MTSHSFNRNKALMDTLTRLYSEDERNRLRAAALKNVQRWKEEGNPKKVEEEKAVPKKLRINVIPDDWGIATQRVTKEYGEVFACLNMANASYFGGGYLQGMVAQEENMFRRTDCHFSHPENLKQSKEVSAEDVMFVERRYKEEEVKLIDGLNQRPDKEGRVYLDMTPRICIRGQEDKEKGDLGYELLEESEVFPFYELRSAALDLRGGARGAFEDLQQKKKKKKNRVKTNEEKEEPRGVKTMRMKIKAQLNTLRANGVRHVVLSAFGCGAFLNPAERIAKIYREEIKKVEADFEVIIFAVYHAGYGRDNYTPFLKEFQGY